MYRHSGAMKCIMSWLGVYLLVPTIIILIIGVRNSGVCMYLQKGDALN